MGRASNPGTPERRKAGCKADETDEHDGQIACPGIGRQTHARLHDTGDDTRTRFDEAVLDLPRRAENR